MTACTSVGLDAQWRVWDDHSVHWASYDLVVLRATWDYPLRRDEFVNWAESVPRLVNPADVVRWNTDKRYLRDLEGAGVPVVPTTWFSAGDAVALPVDGEYVVKPVVGAGGQDTARYRPEHADLAAKHAERLLAQGQRVMVQPYLSAVDDLGETALLYLGGEYSHAIRKGPLLTAPHSIVDGLFRPESVGPREPSAAERELAEQALAAVPGGAHRLLYARVDLLPGPGGAPRLLELELTEPSFFLTTAPGAAERFAEVLARSLRPS